MFKENTSALDINFSFNYVFNCQNTLYIYHFIYIYLFHFLYRRITIINCCFTFDVNIQCYYTFTQLYTTLKSMKLQSLFSSFCSFVLYYHTHVYPQLCIKKLNVQLYANLTSYAYITLTQSEIKQIFISANYSATDGIRNNPFLGNCR